MPLGLNPRETLTNKRRMMKKEDLRIVFMGTPEFAVGTLKALVEGGYRVVAVVTPGFLGAVVVEVEAAFLLWKKK